MGGECPRSSDIRVVKVKENRQGGQMNVQIPKLEVGIHPWYPQSVSRHKNGTHFVSLLS